MPASDACDAAGRCWKISSVECRETLPASDCLAGNEVSALGVVVQRTLEGIAYRAPRTGILGLDPVTMKYIAYQEPGIS